MGAFVQSLAGQIAAPLAGLAAAGIAWLCAFSARWLYFKTKNENVRAAILRLNDACQVTVADVQQSVVVALKEKVEGGVGKLTSADVDAVRAVAISTVEQHLGGPAGVAALKKVLGVPDMTPVIASRIEAAVQHVRAGTPPLGLPTLDSVAAPAP
jgi:hypothetical protein